MCSRSLKLAGSLALAALLATPALGRELRVCADPNNLPFSNQRGEGFENKIAELIATTLEADVSYTWWVQRRGFIRNTLLAKRCDLIPGVPAKMESLATTAPYYRSSYVFVTRNDAPPVDSFDDPALRTVRIGVQMIGEDGASTPPAHALSHRGIVDNVRGYSVTSDFSRPNAPALILDALANRDIDVAIAWGPLAGYFARGAPFRIVPVRPLIDGGLPMAFDIAVGVRPDEVAFRDEIDRAVQRRRAEIDTVLAAYGMPRADLPTDRAHVQ
jgi:mxaJ protein